MKRWHGDRVPEFKEWLKTFKDNEMVRELCGWFCKDIPKEVCHLRLASPRFVKKPVTLRWCTKPKPKPKPSYAAPPSYGPPPPLPPVYHPRTAKADVPIPTESPVYYKPLENEGGRRKYRNIRRYSY